MIDTAAPIDDRKTDAEILNRAREDWRRAESRWRLNRLAYIDDVRFARLGEQWDRGIAKERKETGRPVLTINKLPPFIRQVVNDARQNKPSIKVLPQDSNADPRTAEIYSGLIRNIESSSDADVAYDTALECAASGGFGFFRINLAYVDDASFEKDVVFERVGNPLTVYPDPDSQAADSSDWNIAFVADWMTRDAFKAAYPDASPIDFEGADWTAEWTSDDKVLVAEYWRREAVTKTLILLSNGEAVIEGEYDADAQIDAVGAPAVPQEGVSREIVTHEVVCYKVAGDRVLETTRWPGRWIPIVPVYGEEVNVEGDRVFRSLIRDAKDAQVLYNVNRTAGGEAVARSPIAPWLVEQGSLVDEHKWATANKTNWAYLEYNRSNNPPQRVGMPPVATANLQEALTASDEMKAIIGIYDAGIGAKSNETSGRAIMARQKESDTSTFHFIDNLARAIRCAGRIIIDLLPHTCSPGRILRILGEDGAPRNVRSATPDDLEGLKRRAAEAQQAAAFAQQQAQVMAQAGAPPEMIQQAVQQAQQAAEAATKLAQDMEAVYAIGAGRYDLTVSVGPSFNTRREEAATQMMELIRSYPDAAALIGDLLVKNLDWPEADEIAERISQARGGQAQGGQQAPAQSPDPTAAIKAQVEQARVQMDAQQGQDKLQIDAFRAQTERMRAQHEITQPTRLRVPAQGDFTGA